MTENEQSTQAEIEEAKKQGLSNLRLRKKIELIQKNEALKAEIDDWKKATERSQIFEKHNSQIRAIQEYLHGWNGKVEEKLNIYNKEPNDDKFLSNCANAERLILSEHRIWDYFRSKFIQRRDEIFNLYLRAADEFAWACYQPIQKAVYPKPTDTNRKEPPLVFFNGGYSPFSLSRNRVFQPETVAGEPLMIDPKVFANKLPIPIVGIPWQQISHLPDALVIGHEVGHIVEADFELTARLEEILNEALGKIKAQSRDEALVKINAQSRGEAWHKWLGEIFADIYGCLAGGAAYAGTLIDFLAKNNNRISGEEKKSPDWGDYPTDYLRIKLVLKAVEEIGFKDEIKSYEILWKNYQSKMPVEFVSDIETIIPALLNGKHQKLGDKSIREVFCFSASQQKKVNQAVNVMSKENLNTRNLPSDIQVLFCAMRLVFEQKPDFYKSKKLGSEILNHIRSEVIKGGMRSVSSNKTISNQSQAGAELADELFVFIEEENS